MGKFAASFAEFVAQSQVPWGLNALNGEVNGSDVADQAELVPRRDGRSDDSTGSSASYVQAGGLDGARVAWQSRDLYVASCSG